MGERRLGHGWTSVGLVLAVALLMASSLAGSADAALTISPAPHTPDVSPDTQISILGVPAKDITAVHVRGEDSGGHSGHLEPYSGDRGASFLLDDPLSEGEKAEATVKVRGHHLIGVPFTVAHLGPPQPPLNLPQRQPAKLHHFVSRPDLVPPLVAITESSPIAIHDGKLLITPLPSPVVHPESNNSITIHPVGPGGPMIADAKGRIVWFKQLEPPDVAANLRIQRYHGRKVLTWWQGTVTPSAFGQGVGEIANHHYHVIKTVEAGNGYSMDIHEFSLAPSGDALFTVYSPIQVHLPGTDPGTLSPLLDAIVQEVDTRTGLVTWEWHSYGHIPLSESYATPQNSASYDAFHLNSIDPLPHGRVLVSARDTSAVYKIDRSTGRILWKLGGKDSSFAIGDGAMFNFQHDAQVLPGGQIGMFDDEAGPPMYAPSSRGLILDLSGDGPTATATVAGSYQRNFDTSAQSEGSLQLLPSGRVFLGFGSEPFFSEFKPAGQMVLDGHLPADDGSYRIYREPWNATPNTRPRVAAEPNGQSVSLYASWNGATRVVRWQALAGDDPGDLSPVGSAHHTGFETRIDVDSGPAYFAVQALGARGHVQGTSAAVPAP